jgi:hypothetical protein
MSNKLPKGYEALEPFVAQWARETMVERDKARGASTPEERESFFAAAKGYVPQALAQLDAKPLSEHDERERCLLNLMLGLTHVTLAVEMLTDGEARHARFRQEMRITRTPEDA